MGQGILGLQIKPVNDTAQITGIYKEHKIQEETHKKFRKNFGGKVFYIFSVKEGDRKKIKNMEVINEIREEIKRLRACK